MKMQLRALNQITLHLLFDVFHCDENVDILIDQFFGTNLDPEKNSSLSQTLKHSPSHTFSLSHTHTHIHNTHKHTHSLSLSLYVSLSLKYTHTYTHTHTHIHTSTHIHSSFFLISWSLNHYVYLNVFFHSRTETNEFSQHSIMGGISPSNKINFKIGI